MSDDLYSQFFGNPIPTPKRVTADKPLPQIRGKRFGGVLYLHADDIADALDSQSPKVNRRLIDRIRRQS